MVRTLVDLAGVVPKDHLAKALSRAELSQVLDVRAVNAAMARTRNRPGPGHANLRTALAHQGEHGPALTRSELEDRFLALLAAHDLPRPKTNFHVEGHEFDAVWPERKLAVELDGWASHRDRPTFQRDRVKGNALTRAGWGLLRYTYDDVAQPGADRGGVSGTARVAFARMETWLPAAALRPEHPALVTPDETLTYAELHAQAHAAAATLRTAGIESGDRVAIALPPGVPFLVALHATFLLGAAAVPIDLRLGERERAARIEGAKLVIEKEIAGEGSIEPEPIDPEAVATVIHTSGTTASPKPVELTYGNWLANARGSARALGSDPGDRWLCCLPLSHVGGLSILIRSAIYGTTAILHGRFEAEAVKRAIVEQRVTLISLVPTTLARLLDGGLGAPHALRVALVGGGPLTQELAARAQEAGIPVAQTYGMTEACSQVATSLPGEPETAGRPLLGTTVEIAPDGEILVAGPTVAPGAKAADGWLHTGDLGALDNEGRLTITGRKSDTIVTGGENVAPAEVEAVLLAHPAVADAGVHGERDAAWGEALVATVVLRAPATEDELCAHVAAQLARFKVPKRIAFVDTLPRTASGKLIRRALR